MFYYPYQTLNKMERKKENGDFIVTYKNSVSDTGNEDNSSGYIDLGTVILIMWNMWKITADFN